MNVRRTNLDALKTGKQKGLCERPGVGVPVKSRGEVAGADVHGKALVVCGVPAMLATGRKCEDDARVRDADVHEPARHVQHGGEIVLKSRHFRISKIFELAHLVVLSVDRVMPVDNLRPLRVFDLLRNRVRVRAPDVVRNSVPVRR